MCAITSGIIDFMRACAKGVKLHNYSLPIRTGGCCMTTLTQQWHCLGVVEIPASMSHNC